MFHDFKIKVLSLVDVIALLFIQTIVLNQHKHTHLIILCLFG
jgi:hypothetical protein